LGGFSPTNLVAKAFRSNDGYFIADALVRLEIKREFGIIAFDDDLRGLLDGLWSLSIYIPLTDVEGTYLCTNTTHDCGVV
jgi:hypothetical protein